MLYRDSVSVRRTVRNVAPAVVTAAPRRLWHKPTVAAVFAGRNDDYVADNEARIRAVIEWNSRVLCDEVIFVEWNPLPDRPLLSPMLTRDYPNLRCFVVPPEIHAKVCANAKIPVMEYFAKNVGIRRARSQYVSATNADILWDQGVSRMSWLLAPHLVFRTRRIELRWDGSPPRQDYLRDPRNRVEYRFGWRQDVAYGSGDFTLASRELWHRAGGYDETMKASRINCDGRGLLQLLELGGRIAHLGFHYHLHHGTSSAASGNTSHGDLFAYWEGLPYENGPHWGLGRCGEKEVAERVVQLEWVD
jgi:hypothetical protein